MVPVESTARNRWEVSCWAQTGARGHRVVLVPVVAHAEARDRRVCGFFFVYSLLACDLSDQAEVIYNPFPVHCPRSGSTLQAPICPPPRLVPRR